jgi:hypothetical protein
MNLCVDVGVMHSQRTVQRESLEQIFVIAREATAVPLVDDLDDT